ncbi:MAG: ATP-binding protein [Candidatus Syntropharchaeia archaeon]
MTSIAVTGKGGTGKTVISAMLIKFLSESKKVLAIDADPASSLPLALGVKIKRTIGDIREEIAAPSRIPFYESVPIDMMLDQKIGEILVKTPTFSLLAMGRSEGPGCYCLINDILRHAIDKFSSKFEAIVIDCEAGLEHLSRRTMRNIDVMLIVSDPTVRGIKTAETIKNISNSLEIGFSHIYLVLNKVTDELEFFNEMIEKTGIELIGVVPEDENIHRHDLIGRPITDLPDDSPSVIAVRKIFNRLLDAKIL